MLLLKNIKKVLRLEITRNSIKQWTADLRDSGSNWSGDPMREPSCFFTQFPSDPTLGEDYEPATAIKR